MSGISTLTNVGSQSSLMSNTPNFMPQSSVASNMSNLSTMTNIGSSSSLTALNQNISSQSSVGSDMSNASTMTNFGSQSSSTSDMAAANANLANLSLNHIQETNAPTQMNHFLHASASNAQLPPDQSMNPSVNQQNKLPPLPSLFGSNPAPQPTIANFQQQPQQTP